MCDYSLHNVATRPAQIEDKLVTTKFNNSITSSTSASSVGGTSRRSFLRCRRGQRFALFDHKSRDGFHGRRSLVDAFVDFARLNVD